MKALLLALILIPTLSHSADITIAWDANPPAEQVEGYAIHSGAASGVYTESVDVAGTQGTVTVPDTGLTYLAVTAWRTIGASRIASDYSNEVVYDPATYSIPAAPANARAVQVSVVRPDGTVISVVIP